MKWLLLAIVIGIVLSRLLYFWAARQGDNFGAAFPALAVGVLTLVLTIIYFVAVLWTHRFPW